jgi:release factor glutamine methyltransferase
VIVTSVRETIRALLDEATARLSAAGVLTPRADAEWLLAGLEGTGRAAVAMALDREVEPSLAARYAAALARRERREPLQRILGGEEFRGLRFALTPDVLVPRPETESLVELALAFLPRPGDYQPRVIDVGTGSGCVACAIAYERPDAGVVALESSLAALAVAGRNITALRLGARVRLIAADVLTAVGFEVVDLVVANPPYLPSPLLETLMPEVREHEPRLALDGGMDGLGMLRPLVADAGRTLRPGGALVVETAGGDQALAVAGLFRAAGFNDVVVRPDLSGGPRFVAGRA